MRRAIFSGETGIQFLTLFSVVIAIILFGIINILEGKELAALLGGLSGYILGRFPGSRSARRRTHNTNRSSDASKVYQGSELHKCQPVFRDSIQHFKGASTYC